MERILCYIVALFCFCCNHKSSETSKHATSKNELLDLSVEEFTLAKMFKRANSKKDMDNWELTESSFDGTIYKYTWKNGSSFTKREYTNIKWRFIKDPIVLGIKYGELVHPYLDVPCYLKESYTYKNEIKSFEGDRNVLQIFILPEDEHLFQSTILKLRGD
jgi:hypothetical protein